MRAEGRAPPRALEERRARHDVEGLMARRPKTADSDPLADLAEKTKVLEQEMAIQRDAMQKLKALGPDPYSIRDQDLNARRKTA